MATTGTRGVTGALLMGLLAGATIAVATPGHAVPPDARRPVDYRTVVATLKREIPLLLAETKVVGTTVALVDGDRVVMAKGFGWADRAKRRPVTARTLFHIGSLSKTFTAASVMQLVEQGRVRHDAPLPRYLPELRLLPRFRRTRITVRSVLDHHSGIPGDMFDGMITMGRPDRGYHDWLLRALRRMPPERPANTGWAYNNSGYVLLQLLVEHVTGEPGIAVLEFGPPYALERHALQPDGRRGFTFGWSALGGRRKGDLVRLDARTIRYMGIGYRRVR